MYNLVLGHEHIETIGLRGELGGWRDSAVRFEFLHDVIAMMAIFSGYLPIPVEMIHRVVLAQLLCSSVAKVHDHKRDDSDSTR
jgi:hypothetical protein